MFPPGLLGILGLSQVFNNNPNYGNDQVKIMLIGKKINYNASNEDPNKPSNFDINRIAVPSICAATNFTPLFVHVFIGLSGFSL